MEQSSSITTFNPRPGLSQPQAKGGVIFLEAGKHAPYDGLGHHQLAACCDIVPGLDPSACVISDPVIGCQHSERGSAAAAACPRSAMS